MVQLAQWINPFNIATIPPNEVFLMPRWVQQGGRPFDDVATVWPFPVGGGGGSFWKGFKVIVYSTNSTGFDTITRNINGVDVGTTFTFGPGDPPVVPAVFTDLINIELFKFDKLTFRWQNSATGGVPPKVNVISYFEFPDGFWGF